MVFHRDNNNDKANDTIRIRKIRSLMDSLLVVKDDGDDVSANNHSNDQSDESIIAVDESVRDYICSLLEDAVASGIGGDVAATASTFSGDDTGQNMEVENLVETIESFVGLDLAQKLVSLMVLEKYKENHATTTATPKSSKKLSPTDSPMRLLKEPLRMVPEDIGSDHDEDTTTTKTSTAATAATTIKGKVGQGLETKREQRKQERQKRRQQKKQQQQQRQQKQSNMTSNKNKQCDGEEQEKEATTATDRNKKTNFSDDLLDDDLSAWQECKKQGIAWGGRGKGGRGLHSLGNSIRSNIHLPSVTLTLSDGNELLRGSTLNIVHGHRYGLLGRNGVGKSTLLRRLLRKAIPGMPQDDTMRIVYVQQQMEGSNVLSPIDVLVEADEDRKFLLQEQENLENEIENDADDDNKCRMDETTLAQKVERLGEIAAELDAIQAETATDRAEEILRGLQFTDEMLKRPTKFLSGGWRMRLAMACALFVPSDLLLLDECTNHLDLHGVQWIIEYLRNEDKEQTLIVVSHDRHFLDAVCTDIMVLEHQRIKYHVGNYSDYEQQIQEKIARESQILDASERQRAKAEAFVQKQQALANKKSADPNKQRQAKMIKEKKMDRIGNYREDGKRYQQNSLKKLGEEYLRMAQKVQIEVDDPIIRMKFPNPTWPPALISGAPFLRMEEFTFGYYHNRNSKKSNDNNNDTKGDAMRSLSLILQNVTLSLSRGSKVAIVGKNGAGKSTLLKLISGDISATAFPKESSHVDDDTTNKSRPQKSPSYLQRGELWRHPNIKVGYVTQYAVEELEAHSANMTVLEYAEDKLLHGKASSHVISNASGNVRQYLGAFGLGGSRYIHKQIRYLSGGERMRLCFATVLANEPHLLLLDEATNHVDIETLDSMSNGLQNFTGAILMVSHNQAFLSGFCNELWIVEGGKDHGNATTSNNNKKNERKQKLQTEQEQERDRQQPTITIRHKHNDQTFDEMFSQYRNSIFSNQKQALRSIQRREKAYMAKKATQQKIGISSNTGLL